MHRRGSFLLFAALLNLGAGCETAAGLARLGATHSSELTPSEGTHSASQRPTNQGRSLSRADPGPVRMEQLDDASPPVFVLRGRQLGPEKLVFLHGMCGHGLGYAQSFQHAAARKGVLLAPQADVVCGEGPGAKWSQDVAALDARITAAFRQLGFEEPLRDVCVLGMSQGATRAAALVRQYPERYSRLVSMGAPTEVNTAGLTSLRSAALMVGERERKDLIRKSERTLAKKGVPARSFIIPDADHAGMGPTPEKTMAEMLDWLFAPPVTP
jgi:predicted esterase